MSLWCRANVDRPKNPAHSDSGREHRIFCSRQERGRHQAHECDRFSPPVQRRIAPRALTTERGVGYLRSSSASDRTRRSEGGAMTDFDAIVIGTGQAGPSLAFRLASKGMKVAVIERHLVGGTCVNTGCTPTKALVASAYAAQLARRAAEYGVAIAARSRDGLTVALESAENITLYRGHARFRSPREVETGAAPVRADLIFINVGGRARIPEMPGID